MTIWKNPTDNTLHDDMDGEALNLPVWPQGMIQLTDAEVEVIQSASNATQLAIIASQPNPIGFITAIKVALGGIILANTIAKEYPLFFSSIISSDWTDVQIMLLDAKDKLIVTKQQYDDIKTYATSNNIPITL